jgi:biopolymer transport protein ExbB
MDVSTRFLALTLSGAGWVLWLLIALSVVSLAVMLERVWYLKTHPPDKATLKADMHALLADGSESHLELDRLPNDERLQAALEGAKTKTKLRLERHLAFLATLGSNAPFVGLFGTVLGIIKAFHELAHSAGTAAGGGSSIVMAGISEALVATAVGLMVAIPAVVAFNYFTRRVRTTMAEVEWMAHLALADIKAGQTSSGGY